MVREDLRRNSRHVLVAARGTTLTQHYSRTATANTAGAAGVDYTFTPGVLTFAPGVTTQTIPLTLVDDLLDLEGLQTGSVTLRPRRVPVAPRRRGAIREDRETRLPARRGR